MNNHQEILQKWVFPLKESLEKIMVGQRHVIRRVTMALFAVGQRDFYPDGSRFLGTGHVLCEGPTGSGKCLAKGTPVLMFDGTIRKVEDVQIGDLLMGPDSKARKVVSLGHGFGQMYKVTPKKGESYVVNDEHILSLKMTNTSSHGKLIKGEHINISVKDYLSQNKTFKRNAKGYRVAVDFPKQKVTLDPYYFGVWLGDGTKRSPDITTTNKEIVLCCVQVANSFGLSLVKKNYPNRVPTYALSGKKNHPNPIRNSLKRLGVLCNKHIPNIYKFNSRSVRLKVLAGLMDSDGWTSRGGYDYVSKSKRLAEDVVFISKSLGFAAYMKPCEKKCYNTGVVGRYYRVYISGDVSKIPCRIKKAKKRLQKKDVLVTGLDVTPAGRGEYFGFEIEGPDRLFLLGDFTVTHNTVLCKALSCLLAGDNKRVSGLPDALASDITGCEIILLTGDTKTMQGPLFCNVMLADEINRFPPKAQNAFIEALAEGSVTIANETFRLQQPFFCLATQNPTEQKGTSKIQEALADRFMFKLVMGETTQEEKVEIAKRTHDFDLTNLEQVVTPQEVYEAREYFFDNTYVSDALRYYMARLIHAVNHPEEYNLFKDEQKLLMGDSLFKQNPALNDRVMLHLEGAAMMEAAMNGRNYVLPLDVYGVIKDVFRGRLLLAESSLHLLVDAFSDKYNTETQLIDHLIDEVLAKVPMF